MPVGLNFQRSGRWFRRGVFGGAGQGDTNPPLHIVPQAVAPTDITKGNVYFDSVANVLKASDGVAFGGSGGDFVESFRVGPHATVTEYDLWIAPFACKVTRIDVVPSTLQGGALTATVVKATGTATPVKTTTPMHTADSINLNSGAYTVVNVTLTATAADLVLAAGDRIAIDYSAALTAGHAVVTVSLKRL